MYPLTMVVGEYCHACQCLRYWRCTVVLICCVGLPATVWAAAVPQNYERRVSQLVEDIHGDHAYMVGAASVCCMHGWGQASHERT